MKILLIGRGFPLAECSNLHDNCPRAAPKLAGALNSTAAVHLTRLHPLLLADRMKGVLLLSAAVLLDVQTGVVGALSLEAAAADEVSSARPSGRRLQATCCDAGT